MTPKISATVRTARVMPNLAARVSPEMSICSGCVSFVAGVVLEGTGCGTTGGGGGIAGGI